MAPDRQVNHGIATGPSRLPVGMGTDVANGYDILSLPLAHSPDTNMPGLPQALTKGPADESVGSGHLHLGQGQHGG